MQNRSRVGSALALAFALVACGGENPAPQPPSNAASASSASASASSAPSSSEPAAAGSASSPTATAPESTPSPAPSAPPPAPAPLPPAFIVAQTAFFAQGDRLGDAVSAAASDCAKMGAGIEKVAADPAFAASFKKYVEATIKLTPEQRETAKLAYQENQKKFDGMSEAVKTCSANPKVKGAMDKLTKVLMTNLKPLLEAFGTPGTAGAAGDKPADKPADKGGDKPTSKPGDATKK